MRIQKPLESTGWLGGANNRRVVHEGAKARSTLRTCPKCQRKSLGGGPAWGRVWCLYAAEGACGYSAPLDMDSDVDRVQMTHSDEPTDAEEREGMLAFADSVLGYQESDKRRIGSPVDGALNTDLARRGANYILRLITEVKAGERHLQSLKDDSGDIICDLEDQVKRLDRQLGDELAADSVLCPHAPNHVLEAKCKELEAEVERGCPTCAHCYLKRGGHLA